MATKKIAQTAHESVSSDEQKKTQTEKKAVKTEAKIVKTNKDKKANIMRTVKLEKLILNVGGVGDKLEKGFKLLQIISGKKPIKIKATKRIPTWGVRPGLELGTKVTLRGIEAEKMLARLLPAVNNTLKSRQIKKNFVSFGIHEYIEIPGIEYIREVGIMGFEVTVVFERAGKRIERKKVKQGKARRMDVTPEEISEILRNKFKVIIKEKVQHDSE